MEDTNYKQFLTETLVTYYTKLGENYIHTLVDERLEKLVEDVALKVVESTGPALDRVVKKALQHSEHLKSTLHGT